MEIDILANKYIKSSDWNYMKENKLITKTYAFETFPNAIAWMTEVAFKCEKINHHPDWTNVFSKVIVNLTTHDKGEVTEKDLTLAKIMDDIYAKYKK
tara:strand:- start:681 stop:971 length:291 start_codon:yes stop_codon:yes gene_type:complete